MKKASMTSSVQGNRAVDPDYDALGLIVPRHREQPAHPTIGQAMLEVARLQPGREALVGRYARYDFAGFLRAVDAAANALLARGIKPQDRVAATSRNDPDMVIAFHATQNIGAVWVGISRHLSASEKVFQLKDCGVSVYLADEASRAEILPQRADLPDLREVIDMEPSRPDSGWRELLRQHEGCPPPHVAVDPFLPAIIGYTSGTTGFPKGVVHSQHNMLVATADSEEERAGVTRQGCVMQLTVMNVMINHGLGTLRHGHTLLCVDRADAGGIFQWVRAEHIDGFRAPPPVIYDMLMSADLAREDMSGLVYLATAGAGASDRLRTMYRERFGREMRDGYGLTEAPGVVTRFNPDDQPVEGAIGRPLPHLEVAILDMAGNRVADGTDGEICVRAARDGSHAGIYTPMLGYWKNREATEQALRGGWLHTGDIGHVDKFGIFHLTSRGTDMILRGGANIYPREIERVLEGVAGVRSAIAFGVPHDRLGEIVAAAVEFEAGVDTEELRSRLYDAAADRLAKYKIPAVWLIAEQLPRNTMGKVDRSKLRLAAIAEPRGS